MDAKTIRDVDVSGKRVFLRADLNVPLDDGRITDDTRIRASLPTIVNLLERGASVVLASHLGRPKGGPDAKFSLGPVAVALSERLGRHVQLAGDVVGPDALARAEGLTDGDVLEVILIGVVVTALWAVIGVAFGSVLTNQVAAIVVILAFTQLVEPIARIALGAFDATEGVAKLLPGAATDGLMGASFYAAFGGAESDLLPRWAALLVLLAYAGGLALLGRFTTLRRDIG